MGKAHVTTSSGRSWQELVGVGVELRFSSGRASTSTSTLLQHLRHVDFYFNDLPCGIQFYNSMYYATGPIVAERNPPSSRSRKTNSACIVPARVSLHKVTCFPTTSPFSPLLQRPLDAHENTPATVPASYWSIIPCTLAYVPTVRNIIPIAIKMRLTMFPVRSAILPCRRPISLSALRIRK